MSDPVLSIEIRLSVAPEVWRAITERCTSWKKKP